MCIRVPFTARNIQPDIDSFFAIGAFGFAIQILDWIRCVPECGQPLMRLIRSDVYRRASGNEPASRSIEKHRGTRPGK